MAWSMPAALCLLPLASTAAPAPDNRVELALLSVVVASELRARGRAGEAGDERVGSVGGGSLAGMCPAAAAATSLLLSALTSSTMPLLTNAANLQAGEAAGRLSACAAAS